MGQESLPSIAADYVTDTFLRNLVASPQWIKILDPNPSRWSVTFFADGAAGQVIIMPAPAQNLPSTIIANLSYPKTYTFRDGPSVVTGEWYAIAPVGGDVAIAECIYKR